MGDRLSEHTRKITVLPVLYDIIIAKTGEKIGQTAMPPEMGDQYATIKMSLNSLDLRTVCHMSTFGLSPITEVTVKRANCPHPCEQSKQ